MAFINITIVSDEKKLNEIICKLNKLLAELGVDDTIKKAAADLDASTKKLDEAVKKNTPS